ncbi:hypothetical protein LK994_13860 [Ferruginibacter lapsinanis]|uniref:HD domain-containing protein n=1 Tax=Ferruginibacter lapsinanis TaxID=563172 RepID=UPI001E49E55D|nr:HD domain-containing protein [Ferruginibacter lapsinanis]UEG49723.1 hypothetical protein LK994_13860 [Ferruginibacter lapsinanis]
MKKADFDPQLLEKKVRDSGWWVKAENMVDSHHSNTSGVMLSHHLLAVYDTIDAIFNKHEEGFYGRMFSILRQLDLDKEQVRNELKIVALLHDIGKTEEDKTVLIPHPLTGKPAHKRHGLVSLIAAMEIFGADIEHLPDHKKRIYRTIELHDMSYGLFREYSLNGDIPQKERLRHIDNKIHHMSGAGLLYLLLFKLADTHGHDDIEDVIWFYTIAREHFLTDFAIDLPIPEESDIR